MNENDKKINKYQIIADLQTFYRDITSLEGIDIQIQASKILAYIYENPILQNLFDDKENRYFKYLGSKELFEFNFYFDELASDIKNKKSHEQLLNDLNDYQNDNRFYVNMGVCRFLKKFIANKDEYMAILNATLTKISNSNINKDIDDELAQLSYIHTFFDSYDYNYFKISHAIPHDNIYEYILLKISMYAVLFDLICEVEEIENKNETKIYFDDHDVLKGLDKNQRKLLQNIADIRNRDSVINKYIKDYGLEKSTIKTYISNLVNYFKELGINDNDECKERIDTNLKAIKYLNKLLELNSQWFYKKSI